MNALIGRIGLVAGLLLVAPGIHAQGTKEQAAHYDGLVKEGLLEFGLAHWNEAYNLFKRAHAEFPSARTLRGMGMASYELGEYPRALQQLQAALDSSAKPLRRKMRRQVQDLIDRAQRLVGTLEVTIDPADAQLFINDQLTEERTVVVPVGKVSLRAEHPGHAPARRVQVVDSGQTYPIELRLEASVAAETGPASTTEVDLDLAPATKDTKSDGVLSSPWLWGGVAAVVIGGILVAVLLSGDDANDKSVRESNVGISIEALVTR